MSFPGNASVAVVNIGGAEIVLILVLLFFFALGAIVFLGLIYLIVRAVTNRPPPASITLPTGAALETQQRRDREHLKLLAIFHFVFAGLAFVGIGFLCVHYAIMHTVFANPEYAGEIRIVGSAGRGESEHHRVLPYG